VPRAAVVRIPKVFAVAGRYRRVYSYAPDNATVPDMRIKTMSALEGAASPVRFGGGALEASDRISANTKNLEEI